MIAKPLTKEDVYKLREYNGNWNNRIVQLEDVLSAVQWLRFYVRNRKKGHDSIKVDVMLKVIDEAFRIR